MFDRKVLKERAKFVLSRSFLMSVVACFIVGLITGGISNYGVQRTQNVNLAGMSDLKIVAILTVVGLMLLGAVALSVFAASPLKVGLKRFMLSAADFDTNLEYLLYPFKNNYKNIVWVTFVKNLYISLWTIPAIIAMFGMVFASSKYIIKWIPQISEGSVVAALSMMATTTCMVLITFILMIPAFIKELQYSQVEYILAENPDTSRAAALGKSKEMMVGNKWAYVKLVFSFLGWHLIANTACCIGYLLLTPYIEATYAQLYLELSGQGKDYSGYTFNNPFDSYGNI